MKRIWESILAGIIVGLIFQGLEKFGGINIMKFIYQSFVVELWPMWIGLLVALLYWMIRDYIKLRRFINNLEKWIGLFSYKDSKGSYSDLKGKIKLYIREELEKNKI
jgi:hypothetical protein